MKEKRAPWNSRCVPHKQTIEQRLARYVPEIPDPATGCILWTGPKNRYGYGTLMFTDWSKPYGERSRSGNRLAHRLVWEAANGPIPAGGMICHHCDTPACVNINHLYLGDAKTNGADRSVRGRYYKGPNWVKRPEHVPYVIVSMPGFFR